jgi:hypothetical protein
MNKKVLIYCCGLGIVACVNSVVYASCLPPVANFGVPSVIYCGDEVTFSSSSYDPDGCSIGEGWSASGGASPSTGAGKYFTTKWCSTGTKSVTLTVTDDDRPCCCGSAPDCSDKTSNLTRYFYVQPVNVVSINSEDAVCRYGYITFSVTTSPSGKYECISWSGGDSPTAGSGQYYTTRWDQAGMKTVTATGCNNSVQKQVAVVEVAYISSDDTVCVGCDITFTAITNPEGHGDLITWSTPWSGPATGAGETFTTSWDTAGTHWVAAACGYAYTYKSVTVMEVSNLEVYPNDYYGWCTIYGGSTITVLKGAKYTFKAVTPSGTWPAGEPHWSGIVSGTGQTIDVSFTNSGTYTLTAKCGSYDSGKTVTIEVIEPILNTVDYRQSHSIYNVYSPEYQRDPYRNEPACWTKGSLAWVKVTFWHSKNLTYAVNNIIVRAETSGDSWNIADWGDSEPSTFSTLWPSDEIQCIAEDNINGQVEWRDYSAQWKYKCLDGTNQWITATTQNNCRLYVVLDTPSAPQATPWKEVLDIACNVAWGCDTETKAMDQIWEDFYESAGGVYDTYNGAPQYAWQSQNGYFDLTKWLNQYPSIGVVNCHDMAQAEAIFANALGCGSSASYSNPFGYLNCIYPIGCGWTNNPFYSNPAYNSNPVVDGDWSMSDGRSSFANHGFARLGEWIYDASAGCVDVDLDPDDGPLHFPYRYLDGDDTWANSYENRVVDDNPASTPGSPGDYSFYVE